MQKLFQLLNDNANSSQRLLDIGLPVIENLMMKIFPHKNGIIPQIITHLCGEKLGNYRLAPQSTYQ
jgi:hypothetical protein